MLIGRTGCNLPSFWGHNNSLNFLTSHFASAETLTPEPRIRRERRYGPLWVTFAWEVMMSILEWKETESIALLIKHGRLDMYSFQLSSLFLNILQWVKEQQPQRHNSWGQEHGEGGGNTWRMLTFWEVSKWMSGNWLSLIRDFSKLRDLKGWHRQQQMSWFTLLNLRQA